jgi:hypothetical protein
MLNAKAYIKLAIEGQYIRIILSPNLIVFSCILILSRDIDA